MDRGSGVGRESVTRLCNAIVANRDGMADALWTELQVISVGRAGLDDMRPRNLKDGRYLL